MSSEIKENENSIYIKILDKEYNSKNNNSKENKDNKKLNNNNGKYFRIKKNSSIAYLKLLISDIENISSEKIHIFFLYKKEELNSKEETIKSNSITIKKINQEFIIKNNSSIEEMRDIDFINDIEKRLNRNTYPILYYTLSNENSIKYFNYPFYTLCLIIDFYQQNVDKIIFNLEANCSIFLLKNIISNKLNYDNISQIKLFCIDVTEINEENKTSINIKNNDNNSFSDWKKLDDMIEFFYPKETNERNGYKYNIHFFLTIVNETKMYEQIGLNFRFNYLKEVSKIPFDENAPEYCECSDGINLFIFCFNQECVLYNKYFVLNIGYGVFNILKQIKGIKCPKCNKDNLELKNIGIINSKYYYKGLLKTKNKTKTIIEGDNITLDDKLYIFKEAKINSFLSVLYMQAKPHFINKGKNNCSKRTKEEDELDDIYLSDNINSKITPISLDFKGNNNKIKIYDNESDLIDKNDIIIDGIDSKILDKINCVEDTSIFYPFCFCDYIDKKKTSEDSYYTDKLSVCNIF